MTEIQNPKPLHHLKIREFQTCFGHWIPALWNAASWRPSSGGFHRVKICNLFEIWCLEFGIS
jgi:hypothetical protein